ncbi:MAG: protein kinase, partial [Acidobacteriota bacterium]
MTHPRREVLELLASIADGEELNWDAVKAGAVAQNVQTLRALQIIAGVAHLHRTLPQDGDLPTEGLPGRVIGRIDPSAPPPAGEPSAGIAWGGFVVRERLGSGASADVFRAFEPQLERDVALKLFKSTVQSGRDVRARMLREARALARIRHDGVVRVFGADEHDGRVGIWMELVKGRTLEAELTERGRWSAREAAAAGQDLCRAVAAVHNAGFVHGDIKPQNVIREDGGRLVLMDFGARHLREAVAEPAVSGTPLYLAPEVLAGGAPSPASDVYSLGVLLYHLVSGGYPVVAASMEELKARHRDRQVTRLSDARPDLDPGFIRMVERALALDPAARFHSAGELESALGGGLGAARPHSTPRWDRVGRWHIAAAVAAVAALAIAASVLTLRRPAPPAADDGSVAVLPFRAVGGQGEAAYLSEGVSADLTSLLARLPHLRVVSGVSMHQFRDTTKPADEIGRMLGVKILVAGVVQLSGDHISVTAEMIDSGTSRQIWSERFDRRLDDLFAAQTEIASRIGTALRGRLSSSDARLLQRQPMPYRAFELYSLGRYHWNKRTPDGLQRAVDYFKQASDADPTSALPYAGLADAYVLSGVYGVVPSLQAQELAEAAALRGVELDPTLSEAYAALGSIRQEQLRWPEAETALLRAIELRPGYSPAHHWYALLLTAHGKFDAAVSHMQQAVAQDPLSLAMHAAQGFIWYMKGDFPAAVASYERALEMENDRGWLHRHIAVAHLAAGFPDRALEALDRVPAGTVAAADLNAIRANVYARAGRAAEARALLLENSDAVVPGAPVSGMDQAAARFALGDDALGYAWLERALANREPDVQY